MLNQIKCLLTTISLSQREGRHTKVCRQRVVSQQELCLQDNRRIITALFIILFHALTNTKLLNYKTDRFLMRTRSKSLMETNFPFRAHPGDRIMLMLVA